MRTSTALLTLLGFALLATPFHAAAGQSPGSPAAPATPASFSIADVHALPNSKATRMNLSTVNHDRLVIHHATMLDMISFAYGVESAKLLGGPSWIDSDRFEIAALMPRDTSYKDLRPMLAGLLAERFKLVTHTEDKPQPAYLMTAPKGSSKMKPAAGTSADGCKSPPLPPDTKPSPDTPVTFTCRGESMSAFAEFLHQFVQYNLRQPLVDTTGLKGLWDFEIQLPYTQSRNSVEAGAILKAVETLGLNIAPGTAPQPFRIIDSVNETPTPNPDGLAAAMPPLPPAEFEVTTIKPSPPGGQISFGGPPGVMNFRGLTLRWLINIAWELNGDQNIADAPKWLDEDKFDIVAKFAVPEGSTGPAQVDNEQVPGMLRKLLEERFAIKSHMEERQLEAYALVADKPKMQKADPQGRSGCKEGPGPDGKDPRLAKPILGRLLSCQNVTMAQFAEVLPYRSNGYIKMPVFDATGLPGAYDFVLSFSGFSQVGGINGYSQAPPPGDASTSADPTGGLLMFDAMKQQLGLKLEKQKHPFPMLVLDHINQKPTDN